MRWPAAFVAIAVLLSTGAQAKTPTVSDGNGCSQGTYSVVNSPDGTTLTILFDSFSIATAQSASASSNRISCNVQVPLNLPDGFTLGLYKVDYRGFAHLSENQSSELFVDYVFGARNKSRNFHRKVKGAYDADFFFTETIGAGLMKRIGCGESAVLNVAAALELDTSGHPGEAMVALDSVDGAPKGGLIYHFDLKPCGK